MFRDEVLFANDAFYLAFSTSDVEAMDRVWADRDDVVCIHPGWPALTRRAAVMESWRRILGNPRQPPVTAHAFETVPLSDDLMMVVCYEQVEGAVMVATNVFVATPDGPRLVAHHAGLCSDPPELPNAGVRSFDA